MRRPDLRFQGLLPFLEIGQTIEDEVRSQVSAAIQRGRVEVTLQMEKEGVELEYDLQLNLPLVRSYLRIFNQLNEEFGLEGKVRAEDLCQMKDIAPTILDLAGGRHDLLHGVASLPDRHDDGLARSDVAARQPSTASARRWSSWISAQR